MSNDRFLARVFDKQEGKMFYHGDKMDAIKNLSGLVYYQSTFLGIAGTYMLINHRIRTRYHISSIELKNQDRYVPMQCLGNTDKNKKLIYSADIVATSNNKYLVYREEESAAFWFKRLDNECEILIDDFSCEIEIIGNRWEHPEILEQTNEHR